jgi:hypothetical protein
VVLSYWHKTKCHSSLDSALHKIAWYDPESLATKKKSIGNNVGKVGKENTLLYTIAVHSKLCWELRK